MARRCTSTAAVEITWRIGSNEHRVAAGADVWCSRDDSFRRQHVLPAVQRGKGLGRITTFNYAMGPAEFWVREHDAGRALELLEGLTAAGGDRDSSHDA